MAEHVEALGAVMHAVRGGMREDGAAREVIKLAVALASDEFVQRIRSRLLRELGGGFVKQGS